MEVIYDIIEEQNHKLNKKQLKKRWELVEGPKVINGILESKQKLWDKLLIKYEEKLVVDKQNFGDQVSDIKNIVQNFYNNNDITKYQSINENVIALELKIKDMIKMGKKINNQESIFGKDLSNYNEISLI